MLLQPSESIAIPPPPLRPFPLPATVFPPFAPDPAIFAASRWPCFLGAAKSKINRKTSGFRQSCEPTYFFRVVPSTGCSTSVFNGQALLLKEKAVQWGFQVLGGLSIPTARYSFLDHIILAKYAPRIRLKHTLHKSTFEGGDEGGGFHVYPDLGDSFAMSHLTPDPCPP